MKYLKYLSECKHYFENKENIDPFGEEDWEEKEYPGDDLRNPDPNFDGEGDLLLVHYGDPKTTLGSYCLIQTIYDNGDATLYKDLSSHTLRDGFYMVSKNRFKVLKDISYPNIHIYNRGKWENIQYKDLSDDIKNRMVIE